jgi:spermidine/putrescine-binding protein
LPRILATAVLVLAFAVSLAAPAGAELAAWDQAKVAALGKQLNQAANDLYSTFYKQGPPQLGSGQGDDYRRLKQTMRRIQSEARELDAALAKGDGRDDTKDIYESLMELVRDAREDVQRVFTTKDVQDRATAMRQLLNQIAPYYDPDAQPLQPVTR